MLEFPENHAGAGTKLTGTHKETHSDRMQVSGWYTQAVKEVKEDGMLAGMHKGVTGTCMLVKGWSEQRASQVPGCKLLAGTHRE